jgi:glycolate oxidase iron-sulfur subunit
VIAAGAGCCGALNHHLGNVGDALRSARNTVLAWWREIQDAGLDAIVINTSGCGTLIKDYPHLFQDEPELHDAALAVAERAVDVTELLAQLKLRPGHAQSLSVAYHDACSLRHGQKIIDLPRQLLASVGFDVNSPAEGHLCCGSAGTYNILQPAIATKLGQRKSANLEVLNPDVIAAGNLGCIVQIGQYTSRPVVHTVELLDWATGGPVPPKISGTTRA